MTNIERRLIISQLEKAKENHFKSLTGIEKVKKAELKSYCNYAKETPEIDSLIDLLGAGKV